MTRQFSRRHFCAFSSVSIASIAFGSACRNGSAEPGGDARLKARPRDGIKTAANGRITLDLDPARETILHTPRNVGASPLPLLVMLHGATQTAEDMFWYLGSTYEEAGVAVLAPNSRDTTWDAVGGSGFGSGFGVDVDFLNRALTRVFETTAIDRSRISIGGFSDGASYGLSLGLINGDLFHSIVAFSPGFVVSGTPQGQPRIFISHGTHDHILPIDRCGRRIAGALTSQGYNVTFREFDGDHEIPADVAREGLRWVTE